MRHELPTLVDSIRYVFSHAHSNLGNPLGWQRYRWQIILSYIAWVTTVAVVYTLDAFLVRNHEITWWESTIVTLAWILIVVCAAMISGWGPAVAASTTELIIIAYAYAGMHHADTIGITCAVIAFAVFLGLLSFITAGLSLSWSLYFAESHAFIEELRDVNLALERESAAKDDFINIAAHELRTPLTSLSLTAQLLQHHMPPPDAAVLDAKRMKIIDGHLGLMSTQIQRLVGLLNDMMDTVRLQRGRLLLYPEEVDAAQIVEDVVAECRLAFEGRVIDFRRPTVPMYVSADSVRLAQVVHNYITNACKYSEEFEPVLVTIMRDANEVYISVRDNGLGVPLNKQQEIWSRYYHTSAAQQAHSSHVGLGLGLYICKAIIEAHEGEVGVRSSPGAGSVFWLSLPYHDHPSEEVPVARPRLVELFSAPSAQYSESQLHATS